MLRVALEPFASVWPDCEALGRQHQVEVGDADARRPLALDVQSMLQLDILFRLIVVSARDEHNVLCGYLFFTLEEDPESVGLLEANQGPWYVVSSRFGVAHKMLSRGLVECRLRGADEIMLHHRNDGRGKALARHYARLGAKQEKTTYRLWMER